MTIRQYLKRRLLLTWLEFVGSLILLIVLASYWTRTPVAVSASLVLGMIWVMVALLIQTQVRCPRCAHILWGIRSDRSLSRTTECPYCGVSFDESMPQKMISQ
jgi:hypothetical protein